LLLRRLGWSTAGGTETFGFALRAIGSPI
jgi:hypothetical protein